MQKKGAYDIPLSTLEKRGLYNMIFTKNYISLSLLEA